MRLGNSSSKDDDSSVLKELWNEVQLLVWIDQAENPFLICLRSEEVPINLGQLHAPSVEGCNNAFPQKPLE